MSDAIHISETTRTQIDRIVVEEGYASADELLRKLVEEHVVVREMRAAVSAGLASPAHPLTDEMRENIRATMRGTSGI